MSGPLIDWFYVSPGIRGITAKGDFELWDAPVGIRLAVQEADKSNPILIAEKPWETQLEPLTLWQEGRRYHMHYGAYSPMGNYLCYAYSDDAYHWTKPNLGIYDLQGSTDNNILISSPFGHFFEDSSASSEERYKMIAIKGGWYDPDAKMEIDEKEGMRRLRAQQDGGSSYTGPRVELRGWIEGLYSGDRIHWKRYDKHLIDYFADCDNIAYYDEDSKTYVAYLRGGLYGNRRCVGRTETKNFFQWPMHRVVLQVDPQDEPDTSIYNSAYCRYPGRKDLHFMFPSIYHQITDHLDIQLAVSHDGWNWYRPKRKAIISIGSPSSGEEGMVFACPGLHALPDGRWGLAYGGMSWLHNMKTSFTMMTSEDRGQICWARWQPDRLVGVEAPTEGRFTIKNTHRLKNELRLNYRCKPNGWVKVELVPALGSIVAPDVYASPGYRFEDCDTLTGDELSRVVTWKGKSDISSLGKTVAIRLKMFQATVFAFDC